MFHIELRKFPHVARALNLTAAELHERIVGPWIRDEKIQLDDRRWLPAQAKLTIYEAPELPADQIGIGRGWANVTRSGEEVTDRVLADARGAADAPLAGLREELLARVASDVVTIGELVGLVNARFGPMRVSDRLALAEQCVWELLHRGQLQILIDGAEREPARVDQWEPILLAWETWKGDGARVLLARKQPEG